MLLHFFYGGKPPVYRGMCEWAFEEEKELVKIDWHCHVSKTFTSKEDDKHGTVKPVHEDYKSETK